MAEHQPSSLNRVKVETNDGRVYLSGVVNSQDAKAEVARVAKQEKDLIEVKNNIEVPGELNNRNRPGFSFVTA